MLANFNTKCHNYPNNDYTIVKIKDVKDKKEKKVCSRCKDTFDKFVELNDDWDESENEEEDDEIKEEEYDPKFFIAMRKGSNKIHIEGNKCGRLPKSKREQKEKDFKELDIRKVSRENVSNCCRSAYDDAIKVLTPSKSKSCVIIENDELQGVIIENDELQIKSPAKTKVSSKDKITILERNVYKMEEEIQFLRGLLSGITVKMYGKTYEDIKAEAEDVEDPRFYKHYTEN